MKPHNLVISFIGACLLWVGWFGFNAGSALAASGLATSAFVATHFGAAAATLGWMAAEWMHDGKPSVLGGISGRGGGPGGHHAGFRLRRSRFRRCSSALCAGVGLLPHGDGRSRAGSATTIRWTRSACTARAARWARMLTGVFATSAVNDGLKDAAGHVLPLGLVDGHAGAGAQPGDRRAPSPGAWRLSARS